MIDSIPRLNEGMRLTVQLVVLSVIIGFFPAVPLALMRLSGNPILRGIAFGYIYVFRGTPFVVQLFFFYYGIGQIEYLRTSEFWQPLYREAYYYGLLAMIANTAAYQAEILRGGIIGVPRGEIEAGRACGMSGWTLFKRVIFPSTLRRAFAPYGNEMILMMKASAVVSLVTVLDLMGVAGRINARFFAPVEMYVMAGVYYLVFAALITVAMRRVEHWLTPHLRPAKGASVQPVEDMSAGLSVAARGR